MKKIILQSGLIATVVLMFFMSVNIPRAFGEEPKSSDLIIGERAEEIEGMLHKVEYLFGSVECNNIKSMMAHDGVEVYPEDRITYFPDPAYGIGSKIIIKRANTLVISDAGAEKTYRTWKSKVSDVLDENKIEIGQKDVVDIAKDATLTDLAIGKNRGVVAREGRGNTPIIGKITITRVAETEITQKEEIDFKTITKKDPELEKGKTRAENSGKKGVRELVYNVRRENGVEISRTLARTNLISEPSNRIIYEGTKVIVLGTGLATWYDLVDGLTAASNTLPYGTMVHVVNVENGRSVDVKIVDHGIKGGAIIDLSKEAFEKLSALGKGVISVRLERP